MPREKLGAENLVDLVKLGSTMESVYLTADAGAG